MVYLILADHFCFFHALNSDYFSRLDVATDAHLSKGTTADDREWFEVSGGDFLPHLTIKLGFLVEDVLLYKFLLSAGQIKFLHLMLEDVPGLLAVVFFFLQFLILSFDVRFS